MPHTKRHLEQSGKAAVASLLIGLVLLLGALAACPALHELIHKDADRADHQCAVTIFAHGKVESATCDVPVVTPAVRFETTLSINFFVFSSTIENLPPGRAPPAVVSPLV